MSDKAILDTCGLDVFFFLRYLRTVLKLFIPLIFVVLLILIPLNAVHRKGAHAGV